MDLDTLIVAVYCLVDELMGESLPQGEKLRRRGPDPELDDREVLTMEIVGEFLGIGTDKGLYAYFRRHYGEWFPTLLKVHRTTFSRQAANLWILKEKLWQGLLSSEELFGEGSAEVCIVDSFPMPVCQKARSHRCKVMADLADYGRDQTSGGFFYGMRAHLLVAWPGVIVRAALAPANVHDLHLAERLVEGMGRGWVLADRNYWSPELAEQLHAHEGGPWLVARYKVSKKEKEKGLRWPRWLVHKRRRIETLFSQLVGRWGAKKVWARDGWHLSSRFLRKVLSHTIAVYFCLKEGLSPLRFSELLVD